MTPNSNCQLGRVDVCHSQMTFLPEYAFLAIFTINMGDDL